MERWGNGGETGFDPYFIFETVIDMSLFEWGHKKTPKDIYAGKQCRETGSDPYFLYFQALKLHGISVK